MPIRNGKTATWSLIGYRTGAFQLMNFFASNRGSCAPSSAITNEQCCKSYYPTCQSQSFTRVQGTKKSKGSQLQDFKFQPDLKEEKQNYAKDYHCNCFSKSPKSISEGKIRYDTNQEKKLDDCRQATSQSGIAADWKSRNNQSSAPEKQSKHEYNELEEKVNFLFDIFKGNPVGCREGVSVDRGDQIKVQGVTLSDIWHISNLNRRMCAAEEGIERLTHVLQQVIDKIESKEKRVAEESEDLTYGHSYESNKMNELKKATTKNRADLLTSLMKTFLKIGTVDEIYSKLNLIPEVGETKSQPVVDHKSDRESHALMASTQEMIMESLSRLREQLDEIQGVKLQSISSIDDQRGKTEEKECKYTGSKLEVISEQAEFSLQDKPDADANESNEVLLKNFKEELLHDDGSIALNATTSRLLAQEALLQSSLDKVHYELLTNLDLKGSSEVDSPDVEETGESEPNAESLSDNENTLTCDPKMASKYAHKEPAQSNMKYSKLSDFKDAFKSSLLRNSLNKASLNSIKEEDAKPEPEKSKYPRKSSPVKGSKGSSTLLKPLEKPLHAGSTQYSPELSSGRRKTDTVMENMRPVTAPNTGRKSIVPPTDLRKLSSRNGMKPALLFDKTGLPSLIRKPAFGDVKTSNKNLPKQKFFVQTS